MVIFAFSSPTTCMVGPSSSHGRPPKAPEKTFASASICASVVEGSTMNAHLPLPSWIAFGHFTRAAHFTLSSCTLPHTPDEMCMPTSAWQLPSFELGKPPKLHPHP